MFNFRREGYLWNNHRELERVLAGNGYSPNKRINGFALYQLRQPSADGLEGKFLAFRESRLEQNSVETAIFWTGSSLEEAVESLGNLPIKTIGETVKDKVFGYGSIGILTACFVAGAVTNGIGIGLGAAGLYLVGKAAYSWLQSHAHWQSALGVFGDHVEGRGALSRAIEFAEIYAH